MMQPASRISPDPARVEYEPAVVHLQDVVHRRSERDPIKSQSEMGKKGHRTGVSVERRTTRLRGEVQDGAKATMDGDE